MRALTMTRTRLGPRPDIFRLGLPSLLKLGLFLILFTSSAVDCQQQQQEGEESSSSSSSSTEITWTISKTSSCEDEQQLGCRCETSLLKPKPLTKITCSCNDGETQVVNVKGMRNKKAPEQSHEVTWSIENCNNVTVHGKVLPPSAEADFNLEFVNISLLRLQEDSFENVASSSSSLPLDKTIRFNKCSIPNIPSKAFPSNLKSIEFTNGFIGTIRSNSFKQLLMKSLIFDNTTIEDIEPNAFYQDLDYWIAKGSTFKRIQTNSLTGGIRHMNWTECTIIYLESNAINAVIVNSQFKSTLFTRIDPNGLTIKDWTTFALVNNTFFGANQSAIDLTHRSFSTAEMALLHNNTWYHPTPNFVLTGKVSSTIASVRNNTFMDLCECGRTFATVVTIELSELWFVQAVLKNSRCPITPKATECLARNSSFLMYDELDLLCDVYGCTRELQSVSEIFTPQLPDRLRILAIFIGTLAGAIVVSLLITFCVFLLRRKTSKRNETSDITKSLGGPQDYSSQSSQQTEVPRYKISQGPPHTHHVHALPPLCRPRSTLFEDVEMEDKGVQTMPSELSTDVLEGLREKLSRPDSFWDAKETIDHLYGLIQVREQSASNLALSTSSPPDVTMCNANANANTLNVSSPNSNSNSTSNKGTGPGVQLSPPPPPPPNYPLPMPTSISMPLITSNKHNNNNSSSSHNSNRSTLALGLSPLTNNNIGNTNRRYAQIRSKPKTVATLCEYRDPSDSQVHIYSELSHNHHHQPSSTTLAATSSNPSLSNFTSSSSRPRPPATMTKHGIIGLPVLCEYNEPKDAHAHVYAELANTVSSNNNFNSPIHSGLNPLSTPVPPSAPGASSKILTPEQIDPKNMTMNMNIPPMTSSSGGSNHDFQNSNTHKRPLPAIPTFSSSSVQSNI